MARPRVELQQILENILGSRNVYFQPPENLKLKYPCIIYELTGVESVDADNTSYLNYKRYTVTCISGDPDTVIPDIILESIKHSSFDRRFVTDNLYHDALTIYF